MPQCKARLVLLPLWLTCECYYQDNEALVHKNLAEFPLPLSVDWHSMQGSSGICSSLRYQRSLLLAAGFSIIIIVKYAFIFRQMMPGRIKLLTDITHNRKWHVMGCVCSAPMGVGTATYIYLDKVFRMGIWNGGNLVRTDLCLCQFLDTYIFNRLHFATERCCILNHCAELYYICASSVKKQNALGSLIECSSARGVTGFWGFLFVCFFFPFFVNWAAHLILQKGDLQFFF